jgi:hypothetical protein
MRDPALDQRSFFLFAGITAPRADADADPSFVAHRRKHRRLHGNHRHVAFGGNDLLDGDGGKGLDVAVVAQSAEVTQKLVTDGQAGEASFVVDANHQVAGGAVIGQIVGKGADRFGELIGVFGRDCEFDLIRFVPG